MSALGSVESMPPRRFVVAGHRRVSALVREGGGWLEERIARPREILRPLTDVTSAASWVLLASALSCLVAASRLGWEEFAVAGWTLLAVLLVTPLFLIGTNQLAAVLDLSRDRVVVGERANGRLLVTNTSGRRSRSLIVELPIGQVGADFELPAIRARDEHEQLFAIPTARRTVLTVGPVTALRADPLGLMRREQRLTNAQQLFVHPRTVLVDGSAAGMVRDLEGKTTRQLTESDVSFHALRDYQPGDDRRYIHWKTTVRTGKLMVRQFEQTRRSHLLVCLSTRIDDYIDDDEFETAVSVAGSLGAQALRERHAFSITTSTALLPSSRTRQLLDELSGVGFERGAPLLSGTTRRVAREVTSPSVVIVISGSFSDSSELRRACRHLPVNARAVILRCRSDGQAASVRAAAGFEIATLSDLSDLGPLIRRLTS